MLEINDVSFSYGNQQILSNVNIQINEGSVVGLLGKNGAGKTTFFECLFQTLKYSGTIYYNKNKISRNDISYLETDNYFYPFMKGHEYLQYFSQEKNFKILAEKFNLPLEKYVQNYSSGMKKKLALIGLLLLDKSINILDEPFNGVDFEGVHLLYDIIEELKAKKKTVIISSHIIETLFHTCDKIAILNSGKINTIVNKSDFSKLKDFKF